MRCGQNIVYQYFDESTPDEVEIDLTGELYFMKEEIIARGGNNWRVNGIMVEEPIDKAQRPTVWLELARTPVN